MVLGFYVVMVSRIFRSVASVTVDFLITLSDLTEFAFKVNGVAVAFNFSYFIYLFMVFNTYHI